MTRLLPFFFCLILAAACAPAPKPAPVKTQLEIREFQTRNYNEADMRLVMKSVLNVLQDDGYTVRNVALDLGFLTATKEIDIENPSDRFWSNFVSKSEEARWPRYKIIEATINITEFGDKMRVRTNFQSKVYDNRGGVVAIEQIVDEDHYKEFFSKVDKGIFLQQQNI
jgi:hypothetical protein